MPKHFIGVPSRGQRFEVDMTTCKWQSSKDWYEVVKQKHGTLVSDECRAIINFLFVQGQDIKYEEVVQQAIRNVTARATCKLKSC